MANYDTGPEDIQDVNENNPKASTVLWWIGAGCGICISTSFVLIQLFYGISNARIDQIHSENNKAEIRIKNQIDDLKDEQRGLKTDIQSDISELKDEQGDLKTEIQRDISELKTDIKADMRFIRSQISNIDRPRFTPLPERQ